MFKIISYQRDHFVNTSELVLPFIDDISGTIRGYRIFTACRTVGEKIFRLEDHLDRLYYSASCIYMQPPLPRDKLRNLLQDLVRKNIEAGFQGDFLIDVIFSGGLVESTMKQSGNGAHLYVAVQKLVPPPAEAYKHGVALATFPHMRMCPDVKLMSYIGAILGHQTVVPQYNAFEVLFVHPEDKRTILEGSTFTIFFINAKDEVLTPPLDGRILDSITRRVLFDILTEKRQIKIKETTIYLDELPSFREAFLASTTRNVVPVVRIDQQIIGDGRPGPVTKKIMAWMEDYVNSY